MNQAMRQCCNPDKTSAGPDTRSEETTASTLADQWRQDFFREIIEACKALPSNRPFCPQACDKPSRASILRMLGLLRLRRLIIGDRMPNGSTYAGISPSTGKPFFAAAADEPLTMKWECAMSAAAGSTAHGLCGWRLPTESELDMLYANRRQGALSGTFNETGSSSGGWYRSSDLHHPSPPHYIDFGLGYDSAREPRSYIKRFSDGLPFDSYLRDAYSVRLVHD